MESENKEHSNEDKHLIHEKFLKFILIYFYYIQIRVKFFQ